MKSKKKSSFKKHKTRSNKKGGIGSFKLLSTDKTKIQANIAKLEEINILNKTYRSEEISTLLDEIKKILIVKRASPIYNIPRPPSADFASSDDDEPVYTLGHEGSEAAYDIANTDASPIYDLADDIEIIKDSQQRRTFVSLVKEALDSNNIKNKDDLDKFCEGVGRKRLYAIIKANCLKSFSIEKCNSKHFNYAIQGTYQKLLPGYKQYKPRKGTNA